MHALLPDVMSEVKMPGRDVEDEGNSEPAHLPEVRSPIGSGMEIPVTTNHIVFLRNSVPPSIKHAAAVCSCRPRASS